MYKSINMFLLEDYKYDVCTLRQIWLLQGRICNIPLTCTSIDFRVGNTYRQYYKNYDIWSEVYIGIVKTVLIPGGSRAGYVWAFFMESAATRFRCRASRRFRRYSALCSSVIRPYHPWPLCFFWVGWSTCEVSSTFMGAGTKLVSWSVSAFVSAY
jgi:hypothetical protein